MNRRSFLSTLCLLGGSILIAIGWWDHWHPNQINLWWAGEQLYPFYWNRLALTLAAVLPLALLAWWLGTAAGASAEATSSAQSWHRVAWGFGIAFAIPLILLLKYRVSWLGINYGSSVWAYSIILVLSAIISWLAWPALRRRRLHEWLHRQGPMIILTGIVIYVIVYGGLSIARHASFRTHALDLGTIDQAIWNTSQGRPLEYTPLPVTFDSKTPDLSPDSRLASGRLELISLPLSLLYWIWANPRLMIVLQAILLASGAIPLYHLARTKLGDSTASLCLTLAYLLYLPLHDTILAGFYAPALMVPFLLWAWHGAEQGHWRHYYLAIGIALLCGIEAALTLLGAGIYLMLKRTRSPGGAHHRRHGAMTLLLGLAWLALDFGLVSLWAQPSYGLARYGGFGQDASEIVGGLLTSPLSAPSALLDRENIQALVDLMATLGLMPLLSPLTLLPGLPALVLNLLAASSSQHPILAHYLAPVTPFLFIAAVWGASNVGRWVAGLSRKKEQPANLPAEASRLAAFFVLTTTFLAALIFSPLPPGLEFRLAHFYQVSEHEKALARTLDLIPADAAISAQNNLFPHLSRRAVIYLFPTVADAEYIVLDLDYAASKAPIDEDLFHSTVDGLLADPAFHIATFDDGALLLQRGPGQAPPAFAETLADYREGLYRSAIVEYRGPTRLRADNMYQKALLLENRGTQIWESTGPYPVYLSYHWWPADDSPVEWDGLRTALGQAVKPNDTLVQRARFVTPSEPGNYVLEWDLVHENRTWFGEQGGITLRVDVTVE